MSLLGQLLAMLEVGEGGLGIWSWIRDGQILRTLRGMGQRPTQQPTAPSTGANAAPDTKPVAANRAMADEARELHAFLASISSAGTGINYQPAETEAWIPLAIVRELKPGAARKFLDALATQVVTVRHSRIDGYTKQPPDDKGKPRPDTPVKVEWVEEETSSMGMEIMRGLVWLARQAQEEKFPDVPPVPEGRPPNLRGVLYVVAFLESSRLVESIGDDVKSIKSGAAGVIAGIKTLWDSNDTRLHRWMALYHIRWDFELLRRIETSVLAKALKAAIEAAKGGDAKRVANERYQGYLRRKCRDFSDLSPETQRELRSKPLFIQRRLFLMLAWIILALLVIGIALTAVPMK